MRLIVGLGNPGARYERTRHNAGFLVIDALRRRHAPTAAARGMFHAAVVEARIGDQRCLLIKPTTFMNRSGVSVGEAVRFYRADPSADLLVIVDDIALPTGTIRLRPGGGAGGHNGLADIERALGTQGYPRLRVGIDSGFAAADPDYVLGAITESEMERLAPAIERAADAAEVCVTEGLTRAMNRFNTRIESRRADAGDDGSAGPRGKD